MFYFTDRVLRSLDDLDQKRSPKMMTSTIPGSLQFHTDIDWSCAVRRATFVDNTSSDEFLRFNMNSILNASVDAYCYLVIERNRFRSQVGWNEPSAIAPSSWRMLCSLRIGFRRGKVRIASRLDSIHSMITFLVGFGVYIWPLRWTCYSYQSKVRS